MTFKWELEIALGNHSAHRTDMYGRTTEKARIAVTRESLLTLDWTIGLFFVALISMPVGISTLIWPVPTGLGRGRGRFRLNVTERLGIQVRTSLMQSTQ